jgi:hypothetical protein
MPPYGKFNASVCLPAYSMYIKVSIILSVIRRVISKIALSMKRRYINQL